MECPPIEKPVKFTLGTKDISRAAPGHPVINDPGGAINAGMIPDGSSFGVYAWEKNAANLIAPFVSPTGVTGFVLNQPVTRNNTAGVITYPYDPLAYWPMAPEAKLNFMAYYPYAANSAGSIKNVTPGTGDTPQLMIDFEVSTNSGNHIDLMYAKTGMLSGFDVVPLTFRHALTRLMFEARTEEYPTGSIVKITSIKITNAILKGKLVMLDFDEIQPEKSWWELNNASRGTITLEPTHLIDVGLDDLLQSVIINVEAGDNGYGDMLVLPQDVDGLSIVVGVSVDGVETLFPLTCKLDGTPDWKMNEIIVYEITVRPKRIDITASVKPWDESDVEIIIDEQYKLNVYPEGTLLFSHEGGSINMDILTDYNRNYDRLFPKGIIVDPPADAWLFITDIFGANGNLDRTIRVTAIANSTGMERTSSFTIHAGNLKYVVNVVQAAP